MSGLVLEELGRRYGELEAVCGLSFSVNEGETFGLLGPNGAGKTTTLGMLASLLRPSSGDATVFGRSLSRDLDGVRRIVGLAPQQISLYPTLSGDENVRFFGRINGVPSQRLPEQSLRVLDLVGLTPRKDDLVQTYSGGMQRRLNLACSLVHEPRLLLLDEPTVGVDPQSRENILAAIESLAAGGTTVLYTTHYMEEAERLCDRIGIMDEGRIVALGTLAELLEIVGMGEVIEIRGLPAALDLAKLHSVPGVVKLERLNAVTRIIVTNAARSLGPITALLGANGGGMTGVEVYPVNLERVFMHLTGRALRD